MASTTKRLYAIAASMGLVERYEPEDTFHQLVYSVTGKEHVSDLTAAEAKAVETELIRMKGSENRKTKRREEVPGMMTDAQQRYAWRLIYRLIELDKKDVPAGERMAGAVRKILQITASPKEPLRWVDREDGSRLIETLKRYVTSAERKARG